jgi:hypothetical protein
MVCHGRAENKRIPEGEAPMFFEIKNSHFWELQRGFLGYGMAGFWLDPGHEMAAFFQG